MHLIVTTLILLFSFSEARALSWPVGVSVFPIGSNLSIGFPPPKMRVAGVRVGLISQNLDVYGLDIGVANITTGTFGGIGVAGIVNGVGQNAMVSGLQLAGLANVNLGSVAIFGLQIAGLANYNSGKGHTVGAQISLLRNASEQSDVYGMQLALTNSAKTVNGIQIGLVNVAGKLNGIQIGLLNFNLKARPFGFFPGINIGF